ncbi:CASP-like protein 4D1 [Primulina tabacum]|uniref:CASP-like protein 4D1 n=1 Tax=Primulina tabacum TaxID=48773 RepID=UPI003F5AC40A
MSNPHYQYDDVADYGSKSPKTALTTRVVTLISLAVSIAVLAAHDETLDNGYVLTYKDFRSYMYMFYVAIIGIIYTLLQIPFAIYYMRTKRHLISSFSFLKFQFYADMIISFVLTTGAGSAFGSTMDLKKYFDLGNADSKFQDYLSMGYIPAAFLLVGCIATLISSVHSSFGLSKSG